LPWITFDFPSLVRRRSRISGSTSAVLEGVEHPADGGEWPPATQALAAFVLCSRGLIFGEETGAAV
jgi:hypothetical protein